MESKDAVVELLGSLQDKYNRAEQFMAKPGNELKFRELLKEVDAEFYKVMSLCDSMTSSQSMPETVSKKKDCKRVKAEFDVKVTRWLADYIGAEKSSSLSPEEMFHLEHLNRSPSICSRSSSSSSCKSLRRQSKVKLKLALLAKQHAQERMLEQQAEAEQKAASEMKEAEQRAAFEMREAEQRAASEMREAEQRAAFEMREADRKVEFAQAESDAWDDNVSENESVFSSQYTEARLPATIKIDSVLPQPSPNTSKNVSIPTNKEQSVKQSIQNQATSQPISHRKDFSPLIERKPLKPIIQVQQSNYGDFKPQLPKETPYFSRSPPIPHFKPHYCPYPEEVYSAPAKPRMTVSARNNTEVKRILPNPVIKKFDGDPMKYTSFMSSFKMHIADNPHVETDELRLLFLIQHCSEKVCQTIEHYTGRDGSGYALALNRLEYDFGQPHVIANCCERYILESPKVKANDPDGLMSFSILLEKCVTSMKELKEFASLNSFRTMVQIIDKLPESLKKEWVSFSVRIVEESGHEASFIDLVRFVTRQSEIANSLYGKAVYGQSSLRSTGNNTRRQRLSACNAMSAEAIPKEIKLSQNPACVCCKKFHSLSNCSEFKGMSYRDKINLVRMKSLCFRCLCHGHHIGNCEIKAVCEVKDCAANNHHTLLHKLQVSAESTSRQKEILCSTIRANEIAGNGVYFNVIPVKVRYQDKVVKTYAFLDQGSSDSFCEHKLIENLGATGSQKRLKLKTMTDQAKECLSTSVRLSVGSLIDEEVNINLPEVLSIEEIPIKPNVKPTKRTLKMHKYLQDIELPEVIGGTVTLLIGANVTEAFRVKETRLGPSGCPDAVRTTLGWSLFGPTLFARKPLDREAVVSQVSVQEIEKCELLKPPDRYVMANELEVANSREDRIAFKQMKQSVKLVDGHFQLPLLWKHQEISLPDNLKMAERRLESLKRRLVRDKNLHQRYLEVMSTYIKKGYAEEVPAKELETSTLTWYIPHHPVINIHKPDKLRIVYDCAAKYCNMSLNETLMKGPDLMNSLVAVLTRFRKGPIALVADVEAMFHQVKVEPGDRDALRFLWWSEGDMTKKAIPHRMTVHLFGARSSPSCASFCLKQVASSFGSGYSQKTVDVVRRSFYVDDCLTSVSSVTEGIQLIKELRDMLSKGGFNLTKWLSNNEDVLKSVPEEQRSKTVTSMSLDDCVGDRVLGVYWDVSKDEFQFKVSLKKNPYTRRGLLSTVNSLFDPLGFVTPVTLEARLIMRDLCSQDLTWDENISESDSRRWEEWLQGLPKLRAISLPRSFKGSTERITEYQLHHFADASMQAYGAVCYLRAIDKFNNVHCSFVMGKSHIAPQSSTTIPRLELLAAVTAVRLDILVKEELKLANCSSVFWSDSTAVLQSIYNDHKRFPVFVANRLAEIERSSNISSWRYVPTKLNPADDATRVITASEFLESGRWLSGPDFLAEPPECWPPQLDKLPKLPDDFPLFERKFPVRVMSTLTMEITPTDYFISYFSCFNRLKRATAWILKFKCFLANKREASLDKVLISSSLNRSELCQAEIELVKYTQRTNFPVLMKMLSQKNLKLKRNMCSKSVYNLSPVLMNGMLRVGGRLTRATIDFNLKHPAILPHDSHLTKLLIDWHHRKSGHSGLNYTWNSIRSFYWIEKGSSVIRTVINRCLPCRRRSSSNGKQMMSDLPKARLQVNEPPFSYTGVDYFGPLLIKQGRSQVKRYGCLFTCMTTRAIHLEVAHSLSTDSFISALRRFIGRRGRVNEMFSDNGTNFVGAERILREATQGWNRRQIENYLQQQEITWTFNPPAASHFGGAWERMIRTVRKILSSLSTQRIQTDEMLHTLFVEVEAIVNSRPLTPLAFTKGNAKALSPNDLLMPKPTHGLPPTLTTERDCYALQCWRNTQYLADEFWRRFVKEYLPLITSRQKWHVRKRNFMVNDIVLLVDNLSPRCQWQLGRITTTYPDSTGVVRSVSVKTANNEVKRPIAKLCLIVEADEGLCGEPPNWMQNDQHGNPGSLEEVQVGPGSLEEVQVSPGSLEEVQVSPGSLEEVQVSPGSLEEVQVSPGSLEEV